MKKNVVVLFGGNSSEHDVSCISAQTVIKNIEIDTYNILLVGITREGGWLYVDTIDAIADGSWRESKISAVISPDTTKKELILFKDGGYETKPIDVVFPVLHGLNGEDGTVQGLLELAKNSLCRMRCDRFSRFYGQGLYKDHCRYIRNSSGFFCRYSSGNAR